MQLGILSCLPPFAWDDMEYYMYNAAAIAAHEVWEGGVWCSA